MPAPFADKRDAYAEGWAKACQLFKETEENNDINEFFCSFNDLMIIYGNPNAPKIEGVMHEKHP